MLYTHDYMPKLEVANGTVSCTRACFFYHLLTKAVTRNITATVNNRLAVMIPLYNTACCLVHANSSIE